MHSHRVSNPRLHIYHVEIKFHNCIYKILCPGRITQPWQHSYRNETVTFLLSPGVLTPHSRAHWRKQSAQKTLAMGNLVFPRKRLVNCQSKPMLGYSVLKKKMIFCLIDITVWTVTHVIGSKAIVLKPRKFVENRAEEFWYRSWGQGSPQLVSIATPSWWCSSPLIDSRDCCEDHHNWEANSSARIFLWCGKN